MKVLELSKNAESGRVAAFEFEHKGNGAYRGIVPLRLAAGTVRNTAVSITGQAQTTQAGASRLLLKVDVPYAAKPVDAVDGVVREYGAVSAHIVITVPRRATQDLGGANGSDATIMARRQVDYVLALLLRALGPTAAKDTRLVAGDALGEDGKLRLIPTGLMSSATSVSDEALARLATARWPFVPAQSENEVEMVFDRTFGESEDPYELILDKMSPTTLSPVSGSDATSVSDPTACVDLTVNSTSDDTVGFGPAAMLTRALHGLNPLPDDAVLASPIYLRGTF